MEDMEEMEEMEAAELLVKVAKEAAIREAIEKTYEVEQVPEILKMREMFHRMIEDL